MCVVYFIEPALCACTRAHALVCIHCPACTRRTGVSLKLIIRKLFTCVHILLVSKYIRLYLFAGTTSAAARVHATHTPMDDESPSYWVEHLATFAVGKQYGLEWPADGIHKLRQMERNSAIWAQPMVLRLRPTTISVEDENGELVEQVSARAHTRCTRLSVPTRPCCRPDRTPVGRSARRLQQHSAVHRARRQTRRRAHGDADRNAHLPVQSYIGTRTRSGYNAVPTRPRQHRQTVSRGARVPRRGLLFC